MDQKATRCKEAAGWIIRLLQAGIPAGPAVTRYLEAVLGQASMDEIERILNDEGSAERDSLIDLLLFPDEDFQIRLEPLLMQTPWTPKEVQDIAHWIIRARLTVPLSLQDRVLSLELPDFAAISLVSRLHMDQWIDPELGSVLTARMSEPALWQVRVRLRNAALPPYRNIWVFLTRFFEKMHLDNPDFEACLQFSLIFLSELRETESVLHALAARKRKLTEHLRKADDYWTHLRKSNMEIMLAQGQRSPGIHKPEIETTIRLIDAVALHVFGYIDSFLK